MAVATIHEDRQELLEKLEGLPLKGFSEEEETPSTGTASLPTPDACNTSFAYVVPSSYPFLRNDGWYIEPPQNEPPSIQAPGAPLMKDLDSFTDGTGQGSFDSLPPAGTDQHGQPIHSANTLSLSLLPPADTLPVSVASWRDKVDVCTSAPPERGTHVKRRRSPTPEGERRTRPRSLSLGSAPCARPTWPRRFRSSSLGRRLPRVLDCEQPD